jgi:peptidoglycan/LPS O-acetylase OafA/YrhL
VKYLYCPKCKELRVKAWYQFNERCSRCNSDATVIPIPNSWMTYVTYVFYVLVPALVALHLTYDDDRLIWLAVVALAVLFVVAFADLSRGSKYAKSKIKVTNSDAGDFRRRGWN